VLTFENICQAGSLSSCQDPANYYSTCLPTGWKSDYRCVPVACPVLHAQVLSSFEHPGRIEAVEYKAGASVIRVDPLVSRLSDQVGLQGQVNVTCHEGYRVGSHNLEAPRWQLLKCQSSCALSLPLPCLPVSCSSIARTPLDALPLSPRFVDGAAAAVMSYEQTFQMFHLDTISFACNKGYSLETWNVSLDVALLLGSSVRNNTLEWTPCTTVSTVTCDRGQLLGVQECVPLSRECRTCLQSDAYQVIFAEEIYRLPPVVQLYRPGVELEQIPVGGGARVVRMHLQKQAALSGLAIGDVITSVDSVLLTTLEDITNALNAFQRGTSVFVTVYRAGFECSNTNPCIFRLVRDVSAIRYLKDSPLIGGLPDGIQDHIESARKALIENVQMDELLSPPVVPPASIVHSIINDGSVPYLQAYSTGQSVEIQCHGGYHARPRNESEARCADVDSYTLMCSDGKFMSSGHHGQRCTPHRCVPFANWSLDGNIDQVTPASSLLGEYVNVTCKPGFRPRMANPKLEVNLNRPLRIADPKWFVAKCLANCTYDVPHDVCAPILCPVPAHSRVIEHDNIAVHREILTLQCDLGYILAPERNGSQCESSQRVRCWDGAFNDSACLAKMPCGCGSAACRVDDTRVFSGMLLGDHVASWRPETQVSLVPYGRGGFWSRSITFDNDLARFAHLVNFSANCTLGHRPVLKGSSLKSTCATPSSFSVTCNDCELVTSKTCVPVECPADSRTTPPYSYRGLNTANILSISSGSSLFQTSRLVTCSPYARAFHPQSPLTDSACAAPQEFNITCRASCDWDSRGMFCKAHILKRPLYSGLN
jgi:hypothetical protein